MKPNGCPLSEDRPSVTPPAPQADESGRALIEVVVLGVLVLIPVLYILLSLVRVQAATFAVTQAARDSGRAIDGAPTIDIGIDRATAIAAIALADQNVPNDGIRLQFVNPGTTCSTANAIVPTLSPGAVYDICVTAIIKLPGVPTVLTGSRNTVTGVYTVHISELREGR